MPKVILSDVSNLNNQSAATSTINGNNDVIEQAFDNTLSRDGAAPNEMNAVLDMNSNRIINLPEGATDGEPVTVGQLPSLVDHITQGPPGPQGPAGQDGTNGTDGQDGADGADGVVQSIVAGSGITVDDTDPANPIISATGGGVGSVESVVEGFGILVDDTDAANPIVSQSYLDKIIRVDTRTALKALDTTKYKTVFLYEAYRWGFFQWTSGNYSSFITADPSEGLFIKADAIAASTGAWVRLGDWRTTGIYASWFGVIADSNGTTGNGTNCTTALQDAIDLLISIGSTSTGMCKIILPAGIIRLTSQITIAGKALTIVGQGMGLTDSWPDPVIPARSMGTWLYFDHTGIGMKFQNGATNPQFASRVEALTTMRNHPTPASGWAPTGHQEDFGCTLHMVHFNNVGLLNPRIGFRLNQSSSTFTHIRAQPLFRLVEADPVYDVIRFQDIHMWPYWSLSQFVGSYTRANLICFNLGRVDNPQFSNIFSIRQNIGIRIYAGTGGSTQRFKATNIEFDIGGHGLVVTAGTSGLIIQLVNFVVFCSTDLAADTRGIWIDGTGHNVHIVNVDISNTGAQAVLCGGTNNRLGIVNYRLYNYGENTPNAAGIQTSGSGNIVNLSGSETLTSPSSVNRIVNGGSGNSIVRATTGAAT